MESVADHLRNDAAEHQPQAAALLAGKDAAEAERGIGKEIVQQDDADRHPERHIRVGIRREERRDGLKAHEDLDDGVDRGAAEAPFQAVHIGDQDDREH